MKRFYILVVVAFVSCSTNKELSEQERWELHAKNTEIIRDDFGVPHIYGKTDADAVFGLLYAQAELQPYLQLPYNQTSEKELLVYYLKQEHHQQINT